jgi:hypothetical protein
MSKKVDLEKRLVKTDAERQALERKYKEVIRQNYRLERELEASIELGRKMDMQVITAKQSTGRSEAVCVVLASDWHIEERVRKAEVSGLNEFNLAIMGRRTEAFFQNTHRLFQIFEKDVKIPTMVLALLGDFISGNIHEEFLEICQLEPTVATLEAQTILASGIQFLLDNTKAKLVIPCCVGNHSRFTKDQRHATEQGNSLEFMMYHHLAQHFKSEKRVEFIIAEGYHLYLTIYGRILRFHHGHAIRYLGGIGGLFVPALRAIAQWNRGRRADLDLFAHHHSFRDGGSFICNGSLIGYNAYALSAKCEFEKPKQAMFLIDRDRGKTFVAPVLMGG